MSELKRGGALAIAVLATGVACAQGYPSKPVRIIVPYPPASPGDTVARGMAAFLTPKMGQPWVVENRVGANGIVGIDACAKAAPDGYTMCLPSNAPISLNPFVYSKLPYDPQKDLAPVINLGFTNAVIVVHPSVAAKSLSELVALSKKKPNALVWSSFGYGSISHLYLEWLNKSQGAAFNHVPYKGGFEALTAAVSGEAQATLNTVGFARGLVAGGKLRALAVTGTRRSSLMPDVPSFKEAGFDLDYRAWWGIFVPSATPVAIVQTLNREIGALVADAGFRQKVLAKETMEPVGGSVEEFAQFLKVDRVATERLVKISGVKLD